MTSLPNPKGAETPKINIRYLFATCVDVDKTRHFYSDLLGMKEISYMNEESFGWLCYQSDGFQLMFFRAQSPDTKPKDDWTWQPGYGGGPYEGVSWGINYPEEDFREAVRKILDENARALFEKPQWFQESYWSFPVMDPMGNTIELFWTPSEKPANIEWE